MGLVEVLKIVLVSAINPKLFEFENESATGSESVVFR
jgi:hypothetical protein